MALTRWSHGSATDETLNDREPLRALFLFTYPLPIIETLGQGAVVN